MKRALSFLTAFLLSCNYLPGEGTSSRGRATQSDQVQAPPGSTEESASESFDRLVARADALRSSRPIEALRLYRLAIATIPATLEPQERSRVEAQIRQLAFVLGVPLSEVESSGAGAAPLASAETNAEALGRARALYVQAQEAEHASKKEEALGLYRQILKLIREQDDAPLFWNAWQKLEDLSPDGEGPAAAQEKLDRTEAARESRQEATGVEEDGSLLPAEASSPEGMRAADYNLRQARATYLKGMGYSKAGDRPLAKQAFQQVLELIRESQDPELVRASRQNLQDLQEVDTRKPE